MSEYVPCMDCVVWNCELRKMDVEERKNQCKRLENYFKKSESKEMVNHPSHYNQYPKETIDMMVDIFGKEATRQWCVMTAFKYWVRMGCEDDIQQDFEKEQWYLNKA